MGLEGFAVLSKKEEDLLKKGYCYQTFGLVTLNTTSGPLFFKARASQRLDSSTVAKASVQFKHEQITFTPKRKTDGNSNYVLEYAPNADVKLKSECKVAHAPAPDGYETTVSAEYSQPSYKAKIALAEPNLALKFSGTFGNERFGLALDGKFDVGVQRLQTYNLAQYWFEKGHRVVFKHLGTDKTTYSLGDFVLSYHQVASAKTEVGANVRYNYPKKESFIEFGGSHALSCCTTLKGKVDSNGLLAAAFSKKFGNVRVSVASQIDLKKATQSHLSDYKLGLRLDLNA